MKTVMESDKVKLTFCFIKSEKLKLLEFQYSYLTVNLVEIPFELCPR
jgi:hypothetical protein